MWEFCFSIWTIAGAVLLLSVAAADDQPVTGQRPDNVGEEAIELNKESVPRGRVIYNLDCSQFFVGTFGPIVPETIDKFVDTHAALGISGGRFHDDTFEWPKKGWRRLHVIAHSADQDHIILDGTIQDGYTCDRDSVNLLARKQDDASVLLVSDYSPSSGRVIVSVPGDEPLVVKDLYTGNMVAKLTSQQRGFRVELKRDFTARLYHLQDTEAR